MITSTTNKQIKYVNSLIKKAKTRKEEGLFVAEGFRMCQEIPRNRIHTLYLSESAGKSEEMAGLAAGFRRVELVSDEVFQSMADTKSPQGILALVDQLEYSISQVTAEKPETPALLMILERLQDPGNLGTIIRAGEGAGVTGILMDQHTADIYNPKVIRSTMGSVFRVPFAYTQDLPAELTQLKARGMALFAGHLEGKQNYDQCDYRKSTGFLIGNEATGLTENTAGLANTLIRIPMLGQVESLNAAVASAVLMFECARQRRH